MVQKESKSRFDNASTSDGRSSTAAHFTHPISFDEQRKLSPEEGRAYCDFILSRPLKTKVRLTEEELLARDYDMVGTRRRYELGE